MAPSDAKQKFQCYPRPGVSITGLTGAPEPGTLPGMIPPLTSLTGAPAAWSLLALKALAAGGFMALANLVILYAC